MQPSSRLDRVVLMVQIQEDIKRCSGAPEEEEAGVRCESSNFKETTTDDLLNFSKGHDEDDGEKNSREDSEEGQEGGVSSGNSSHLCSSSALLCEGRLEARCAPLPAESLLHRRHQRL